MQNFNLKTYIKRYNYLTYDEKTSSQFAIFIRIVYLMFIYCRIIVSSTIGLLYLTDPSPYSKCALCIGGLQAEVVYVMYVK